MAFDNSGYLYVVDQVNNRIEKFSSSGAYISEFDESYGSGNGQFISPQGIAFDKSGNFYVVDQSNNRVEKFSSSGAYISQFGSSGSSDGQFNIPFAIAFDSSGNIYVTDLINNRVEKFSSSGAYISQFGSSGSSDGQFIDPAGIAFDGSGDIYVADYGNNRIEKFDSAGGYVSQFGSTGNGNGQLNQPIYIAIDNSGNIFVADTGNYRIEKFSSSGAYISQFGSSGSSDGQFGIISGIVVDNLGNIYVTDTGNNRIQVFAGPPPVSSPIINVPSAISVNTDSGVCTATNPSIGTATSSGGKAPVTISDNRPNPFPLGQTIVTWTATDSSTPTALTDSKTQTVTVVDNQNPTITAPIDLTAWENVVGGWIGSIGSPTVSDNCPGVTYSNNAPAIFPPGTTTVTWTAVDGAGHTSTATQHVTVNVQIDNTVLTLKSISNEKWGKSISVTGTLKDSSTKKAIAGSTITFTGSGSSGLPTTATTNSNGVFTVKGLSPNTVGSWQIVAHYAGDSTHRPADSNTVNYNTSKHKVSLTLTLNPYYVKSGLPYGVSGNLVDSDAGNTPIGSATITFTAKSPIAIPSTSTASNGIYQVNNLVAPASGQYTVNSSFAGDSLYNAKISATKTLNVK